MSFHHVLKRLRGATESQSIRVTVDVSDVRELLRDYDRIDAIHRDGHAAWERSSQVCAVLQGERDTLSRSLADRDVLLRGAQRLAAFTLPHTWHQAVNDLLGASAEPAKPQIVECDACPTSGGCVNKCMKAPAPVVQQQSETSDQIAAVMLLHGTPEQQAEAARYAGLAALAPVVKQGGLSDDSDNIAHLAQCADDGCGRCENLMYFYQACDECGAWGHNDAGPCSCAAPVAQSELVGALEEDAERFAGLVAGKFSLDVRTTFVLVEGDTYNKDCAPTIVHFENTDASRLSATREAVDKALAAHRPKEGQ